MSKRTSSNEINRLIRDKNAVLIDLCSPVSFRDGGVTGSKNMSLRQLTIMQREQNKTIPIILMGDPEDEKTLPAALTYLEGYGFTQVYWIKSRSEYTV